MSILGELLFELVTSGVGPRSDKGLVATLAAGSLGFSLTTAWLITTSANPLQQPDWGWALLAGSIICGAAGLLVSGLHLWRSHTGMVFSVVCLASNLVAIAIPTVWLITR